MSDRIFGVVSLLLALFHIWQATVIQENPDVVWGLIAALFLGNIMLLLMNIPMVSLFVRLLLVPPRYLMPAVALIPFIGIYGISGSTFDLMVMVGFGLLGWVLRKLDVPLVPIIFGGLLGDQMEKTCAAP